MAQALQACVETFERVESRVRFYCRTWPVVFESARGHEVRDRSGRIYLDFFSGAGALNYGHNNPALKDPVIAFLNSDGILHSLDMFTGAKQLFLEVFEELILSRLSHSYNVMFSGPTGTDGVEAAIRLARKASARRAIVAFRGGFHGMTLGSLSLSERLDGQGQACLAEDSTILLPFDGSPDWSCEDLATLFQDRSAQGKLPAAVIFETVQGEGGVNVATTPWLQAIFATCRVHNIITICDDVQAGCGRTGPFLSSERAGVCPDLIVLSKSLGGLGLPLTVVLVRRDLDVWDPGEHTGTFRGQSLAFVAGAAALNTYWRTPQLTQSVFTKGELIRKHLSKIKACLPHRIAGARGIGLFWGLEFSDPNHAGAVSIEAFRRGLLAECAGKGRRVLKLMPPLTIDEASLERGLALLVEAVEVVCK